jgi:hemerythrin-like domain-containing protein
MKITDILRTEHAVFCVTFDQIERTLPNLTTPAEIKGLANLLETLLRGHGETEQNLAYTPLDHMLEERKHLTRLFSDHREMDSRMKEIQATADVAQAKLLLRTTLALCRQHFRFEEQSLFPLVEKVLKPESLEKLGEAHMQKRRPSPA